MKLDRNNLTRKQNTLVALSILVSLFLAFCLPPLLGEFAIFIPIFGISGANFWMIRARSKNIEKLRSSEQKAKMEVEK